MKKEKRKFPFTMKKSSSSMQVPLKKQQNYYLLYFNSNRIIPKNVSVTLEMTQTCFIKVHLDFGRKSSHSPSR
ncbi:unnamed protein product [Callosobruchus maculatus]|uniref:Uncharacterized protein n=1 Tax=Callosobruchus maculatus TaxID=64391 RepID=A0A653CZ46_CALMS|nr:unnamed protein product [Callosobruchus maculatus]